MKAIICTNYGSPNVLQLQEVAQPVPKDNEVLVKLHAAVVGPADCAFRKGDPFIVKLIYGLRKPRLAILGVEFAGEVAAVGAAVQTFRVGDQLFGMSPARFGAHAEYICLPEDKPLVTKPAQVSYEDMVGVCDGAATSLTFLRDVAKVQREQKVLINGASGAVGAYGVQLAAYFGAQVTAVCGPTNLELVKSLGADVVIDYTKVDFTQTGQTYDVIFDAVGKRSFAECQGALTPQGIYMTTVPTLGIVGQIIWRTIVGGKKAKFVPAGTMQNKENLTFLKELVVAGKLRAVIDRRYPLESIAEAHTYVDKGHKKGNVIITFGTKA